VVRTTATTAAVALLSALLTGSAAAHGVAPEPTSLVDVLLAWQIEAHVLLPLLAAWLMYRWGVGRVRAEHPRNPVPRYRVWCWNAGLLVLFVALASPIATYDGVFFTAHMVQHLLLTLVAAPLLALGAPITLLLRVVSSRTRRGVVLPVLHSRVLRVVSFPVVTWSVFAFVMWASHFSPLFDAALESELVHVLEHALYLGTALLFWWPVVGADPSPWRLPHAARIGYAFLGMPQSSFLGLAIFSAPDVLYPHYGSLVRAWGPTALADQQLAGGVMWVGGDLVFLIALVLAIWVWMRAEEAEGRRADAKLDRETAAAAALASAALGSAAHPAAPAAQAPVPAAHAAAQAAHAAPPPAPAARASAGSSGEP
jgi:putative copper resistance protein D